MAQDAITVTGIEQYRRALARMQTDNPATRRELQSIIRRAISQARKNVVKDAQNVLENDPRHAYKAVRSSVYRQVLGGQINILSPRRRGSATRYQKPRKLDETPGQRGGNRRRRSERTMQVESYEGKDRGFILRFLNAGTADRETRFGGRGHLTARHWFGRSSAFQLDAAASRVATEIERMLQQEFHTI